MKTQTLSIFLGLIAALSCSLSANMSETLCLESVDSKINVRSDCRHKEVYHAQASQDEFVYSLLYGLVGKSDRGTYLEIGAGPPVTINNTYFFESLNWNGVSIDITADYAAEWNSVRKNPLLIADATLCDYSAILETFPNVIDYLSLDVDAQYDVVLNKIPLDRYIFKVITIEHDAYKYGDMFRLKEREILSSFGYYLLCPDVSHPACGPFEDWWIHPSAFSSEDLAKLASLNLTQKYHAQIVAEIGTLIHR